MFKQLILVGLVGLVLAEQQFSQEESVGLAQREVSLYNGRYCRAYRNAYRRTRSSRYRRAYLKGIYKYCY
jgi:hypothetical protein